MEAVQRDSNRYPNLVARVALVKVGISGHRGRHERLLPRVRGAAASGEIHLAVSDSGAGFDSEVAKEGRGLGLISMEERLKLLNGTLSVESQPNRGTTIRTCVPLSSGTNAIRAAG
jgi:signal transduction histidine kinase